MNKDTAASYLPLVQALSEGKVIQKNPGDGTWYDLGDEINFNCDPKDYRIRPEPRRYWIALQNGFPVMAYDSKPSPSNLTFIPVIEIFDSKETP